MGQLHFRKEEIRFLVTRGRGEWEATAQQGTEFRFGIKKKFWKQIMMVAQDGIHDIIHDTELHI